MTTDLPFDRQQPARPRDEQRPARVAILSPDCAGGKCTACSGDAWDHELDEPAACQCPCAHY